MCDAGTGMCGAGKGVRGAGIAPTCTASALGLGYCLFMFDPLMD